MKKKIMKLISLTVVLMTAMSLFTVNAAGKLSEYDYSAWTQIRTQKIDFQNYAKDEALTAANKPTNWGFQQAANGPSKIAEEGGNKYLAVDGYIQLFLEQATDNFYAFSADLKSDGDRNFAMFARAGKEKFTYDTNFSDFYEADRGNVNGGVVGLGGSGFYVKPFGTKIRLFMKLYDAAQKCKINNVIYDFETGVDFATGLHKVTMIDDGLSVSIYVEDSLIAKVAFSEVKKYDIGTEDYYSKAIITKADGSEVATINNAIISTKSVVAIGVRNTTVSLDNVQLTEYTAKGVNPGTNDAAVLSVLLVLAAASFVLVKRKVNA